MGWGIFFLQINFVVFVNTIFFLFAFWSKNNGKVLHGYAYGIQLGDLFRVSNKILLLLVHLLAVLL